MTLLLSPQASGLTDDAGKPEWSWYKSDSDTRQWAGQGSGSIYDYVRKAFKSNNLKSQQGEIIHRGRV